MSEKISNFIGIVFNNLITAIFGAFVVYVSIYFSVLMFVFLNSLNIPSITLIVLMFLLKSVCSILLPSINLDSEVSNILSLMNPAIVWLKLFISQYDYLICYIIAFCDGIMEDFDMINLRQIVNKTVEYVKNMFEKVFSFF